MKTHHKAKAITPEQIDTLLPQTQCELCEYPGCRPYAEAIAYQGERIDRCPPGGVRTLYKLAALLEQDPEPMVAELQAKEKSPSHAIIQEDICIGCTKCIQACPVDAILGASKQMHTVITDECNGCELCIPPCPVDCIDMQPLPPRSETEQTKQSQQWRTRYDARQIRLQQNKMIKAQKHREAKLAGQKKNKQRDEVVQARQDAIAAALARTRGKMDPL